MRPRIVQDADLLELLLTAFAELGYDGASMRALCGQMGVSHNLVQKRFASKEAAWYAAVDHGFGQLLAELVVEPAEGEDLFEAARAAIMRFATATHDNPALARIIQQEAGRPGPRFDYMYQRYIGPVQDRVSQGLTTLQERGEIRPGPVSTVWLFAVTWGIGGLASSPVLTERLAGPEGGADDEALAAAELAADVLLDGLRSGRATD